MLLIMIHTQDYNVNRYNTECLTRMTHVSANVISMLRFLHTLNNCNSKYFSLRYKIFASVDGRQWDIAKLLWNNGNIDLKKHSNIRFDSKRKYNTRLDLDWTSDSDHRRRRKTQTFSFQYIMQAFPRILSTMSIF